jgi:predicted nucleic acid-binding protein
MIYAYWFEDREERSQRVQQIHDTILQSGDALCSSLFVLSELLVGPVKLGDIAAADLIEQYFSSDAITMLPYTQQAVRLFAQLRAQYGIKALDALHLAIATHAGVDLFLTHDRRLHKLTIPGIPFIASLETDLF